MGVDLRSDNVGYSRMMRVVAAVVVVSGLFLLTEGLINERWVQVLWVTLGLSSGVSGWVEARQRRAGRDRRISWPYLSVRGVWYVGLCLVGVLVMVIQDSILVRVGGGFLVAASLCGVLSLFYAARSRRAPAGQGSYQ